MKILQIAPPWVETPPRGYGGTEWVIANLVKGLSNLGHVVTLFATKDSKSRGKVKFIFEKALSQMQVPWNAALPALIHYHQAFKEVPKYDFIHAHLSSATDLVVLPFLADLSEKGIPNLVTIHSQWPFDRYSQTDKVFLSLYASKVLAVNISAAMQKMLPKQFRDGGLVHNSLDVSKMKFNAKGGNYLTWLGKILPEKGTAEAIKIAKKAGEQLIFAGIVDKQKEKSVRYFESQVKPLIDNKQIKYLGPADLKLKNKLLGGAKAFLNPITWDEPFGMVVLESMACGTPPISYKRGAIPELIENGRSGFLVNNKVEMVKAIKRVNQIDRGTCRQHIEEHFSPESAALKYLNIYWQEMRFHAISSYEKQMPQPMINRGSLPLEHYRS